MDFTLLFVEDSQDDFFLMERALQKSELPAQLKWVQNGQEAVSYLSGTGDFSDRVLHPLPSIILSDLKMPRMSGLELLKWVRSKPAFNNIPFVMLTASDEEVDLEKAYRLGVNSFLTKPADYTQLVELSAAFKVYWIKFNRVGER